MFCHPIAECLYKNKSFAVILSVGKGEWNVKTGKKENAKRKRTEKEAGESERRAADCES